MLKEMIPGLLQFKKREFFRPLAWMDLSGLFRRSYFDNSEDIQLGGEAAITHLDDISLLGKSSPGRVSLNSEEHADCIELVEEEPDVDQDDDNAPEINDFEEYVHIGKTVSENLARANALFSQIGADTSPLFEGVGRDLRSVSRESKALTQSLKDFAGGMNGGEHEKSSLDGVRQLVQNVAGKLQKDHRSVEDGTQLVGRLLRAMSQIRNVYERINAISSSFRVIRINIQVQCNVNAIRDDLFQGLSADITSLSQRMDNISRQIISDMFSSERNMTSLNRTVTENLDKIRKVSARAETGIAGAFTEIERLVQGSVLMMDEAESKSRAISSTVGEVVVGLQFHDSMSQKLENIEAGIESVREMLERDSKTVHPELLGTAFRILDENVKQLDGLGEQLSAVRCSIERSFESLGVEVNRLSSVVQMIQRKGDGQDGFLTQSSSLEESFSLLFKLFSQGQEMKNRIRSAAVKTQETATGMSEFAGEMDDIQDETKLQAVNTIIMATSLGDKGKTIEVLAREISSLSDQTSLMTAEVNTLQENMRSMLDTLAGSSGDEQNGLDFVEQMKLELDQLSGVFNQTDGYVETLLEQIAATGAHIDQAAGNLEFIGELEEKLVSYASMLKVQRNMLEPWKGKGADQHFASDFENHNKPGSDIGREKNDPADDEVLFFDGSFSSDEKDAFLAREDEQKADDDQLDELENVELF